MTHIAMRALAFVTLVVYCATAEAQLSDHEELPDVEDQVVVVGTPPDDFGFADMGAWLSFVVIDFDGAFGAEAGFSSTLGNFLDELNEASEQVCQDRIADWRVDCHDTYEDFQPVCILTGAYSGISLARAILPSWLVSTGSGASGSATAFGCLQLTQRAHQWCDVMADSEAAPDIAECP